MGFTIQSNSGPSPISLRDHLISMIEAQLNALGYLRAELVRSGMDTSSVDAQIQALDVELEQVRRAL